MAKKRRMCSTHRSHGLLLKLLSTRSADNLLLNQNKQSSSSLLLAVRPRTGRCRVASTDKVCLQPHSEATVTLLDAAAGCRAATRHNFCVTSEPTAATTVAPQYQPPYSKL